MPTCAEADARMLLETVRLATDNVGSGGGPFGALIAGPDGVVATGVNRVTATRDPSAHAEIVAIRAACARLGTFRLDGHVLVSSCEPCPMCLSCALWARVDRIVYSCDRADAARAGFDDRTFYELFDRPRERWPIAVNRVPVADSGAPFTAWHNHIGRIAY